MGNDMRKPIKAGDIFRVNYGGTVTVIEYINSRKIFIVHNDEFAYKAVVTAGHLRDGKIKNPFAPSLLGVGYIGVGKYVSRENRIADRAYSVWADMLKRCYCKKYLKKYPTYSGCTTHKDWHNFQVFAEWYYSQKNSGKSGFELDKDLIVLGNKEYSAEACSLLPSAINNALSSSAAKRGDMPQGVSRCGSRYRVQMGERGRKIVIGQYDNIKNAIAAYSAQKEAHIKSLAAEYRSDLPPKVYQNLMSWKLC